MDKKKVVNQEKRKSFPVFWVVLGVFLFVWLTCTYSLKENEYGILLQFNKMVKVGHIGFVFQDTIHTESKEGIEVYTVI